MIPRARGIPRAQEADAVVTAAKVVADAAVAEADEVVLLLLIRAYTTTHGSDWPKNKFFPSFGQIQFLLSC